MNLIVGLGNPGEEYKQTRHNLGFMVLNCLAEENRIEDWRFEKKFNALLAETVLDHKKTMLTKPQAFMNNSGQSVAKIADYFKIKPENITVIHDDMDLILGDIKIQIGRSSAGHKGVESIINHLNTKDFKRVRIGIKPENETIENPENFVIQKFRPEERNIMREAIKKAAHSILNPGTRTNSMPGKQE